MFISETIWLRFFAALSVERGLGGPPALTNVRVVHI